MRSRGRTDKNQAALVRDLRLMGYSVMVTSGLAAGFPDLVVGAKGINYLFEVKNPEQFDSKKRLNSVQEKWHASWRGRSYVVETTDDCLFIINNTKWGDVSNG